MPLSKNSFNWKGGRQKGPGADASVITEMRRQSALLAASGDTMRAAGIRTKGLKRDPGDSLHTRGVETIGTPIFLSKGIRLNFFRVQ